MRTALLTAAALAGLCSIAACLDTAADQPGSASAHDAGTAGRGSEKPPTAPSTRGLAIAGGSAGSERSKASQAGSSAAATGASGSGSGSQGLQPMAAGARAPHAPSNDEADAAPTQPELPKTPVPTRLGDLVISELMIDPKALPDTQGEWIELYNASGTELSLRDCQIDDGVETLHAITNPPLLQPGDYATLARSANPGFTPTATVALSLTNSADTLAIICRGIEIDRVTYDKAAGFDIKPGVTLSLDPDALSAQQNDAAEVWCTGQNLYNDDFGTPGRANPSCYVQPDDPDAGTSEE